jgi:hypothetical protein
MYTGAVTSRTGGDTAQLSFGWYGKRLLCSMWAVYEDGERSRLIVLKIGDRYKDLERM